VFIFVFLIDLSRQFKAFLLNLFSRNKGYEFLSVYDYGFHGIDNLATKISYYFELKIVLPALELESDKYHNKKTSKLDLFSKFRGFCY